MNIYILSEVSIDGKITTGTEASSKFFYEYLTTEEMKYIHKKRSHAQAIIVGKRTIDIDNPSLTERFFGNDKLIRIIPSNSLDFDFESTIFQDDNETIIVTKNQNKNHKNVEIIRKNGKKILFIGNDEVDFVKLRDYLDQELHIKEVIVEGGGTINSKLIEADIIDGINITQFPLIIGDQKAPSLVDGNGFSIDKFPKFHLKSIEVKKNFISIYYEKGKRVKEGCIK